MQKTIYLAAALAAILAAPASAEGLGGFYAGGELGYGKPKTDLTYAPPKTAAVIGHANEASFDYGGFVGYGVVLGERIYLGAEGGLGTGGSKASKTLSNTRFTVDPKLRYSLSGRAGLLLGESGMIYGKLGVERRRFEVSTAAASRDLKLQGVVYGIGYQQMVSDKISVRAELDRVNYGDKGSSLANNGAIRTESKETRLVFGGAYHF